MKHMMMGIDTAVKSDDLPNIFIVDYLPKFIEWRKIDKENQLKRLEDVFESIYPYYNFDLKSKNKTNRVFKDIDPYGEENWEE